MYYCRMDYRSTIRKLASQFYEERTMSHLNNFFFLSSHLHFSLTLEIALSDYSNNEISLEKIYEKIPRTFGSRSKIKYTLNQGVTNNFFIKRTSKKDKRIKIYTLNEQAKKTLEAWLDKRKILYI